MQDLSFNDFFNARIAQSNRNRRTGFTARRRVGCRALHHLRPGWKGESQGSLLLQPQQLNFAPRVAFAWAPSADRKTIFNGGAGIVYDQQVINAIQYQQSQYSYLFQSSATIA